MPTPSPFPQARGGQGSEWGEWGEWASGAIRAPFSWGGDDRKRSALALAGGARGGFAEAELLSRTRPPLTPPAGGRGTSACLPSRRREEIAPKWDGAREIRRGN